MVNNSFNSTHEEQIYYRVYVCAIAEGANLAGLIEFNWKEIQTSVLNAGANFQIASQQANSETEEQEREFSKTQRHFFYTKGLIYFKIEPWK